MPEYNHLETVMKGLERNMERLGMEKVKNIIITNGMVPLFYFSDWKKAVKAIKAVWNGGCRIIEFTNRGGMALEVFKRILKVKKNEYPEMIIGAGSIINSNAAADFLKAGADFIVGPNFDEEVAKLCSKEDIVYIPGAATPTEIANSYKSGSEIIKVFPASCLGGPGFIKAVLGPMPWLKLMVTGGVKADQDEIKKWFESGVTCVGLGSDLINKSILEEETFNIITEKVSEIQKTIDVIKSKL